MDERLKQLREQYDAKSKEAQDVLGKGPEITAEDIVKVKALNDELNTLSEQMTTLSEAARLTGVAAARDEQMRRPVGTLPFPGGDPGEQGGSGARATFLGFTPAGSAQIEQARNAKVLEQQGVGTFGEKAWKAIHTEEYHDAFQKYLRHGMSSMFPAEQKLLQEGIDPQGGFLVPADFQDRVIMRKPTPTRVANFVMGMNTSRDKLTLPKVNYSADEIYTTGIRVTWTGEVPASATVHRVTDPMFGTFTVPIYTAMMSIPVTNDLIEDSVVALQPWLEDRFFETNEILVDDMILNGTGISQPTGILSNPGGTDQPATVVTGDAALLTPDGIINLAFSLPEQYDDNARFIFNKTNTGRQIALLKDADDRYLWGSGLQDSGLSPAWRDRQILGYPTALSGLMPNVGAGTFPIIFGDLRGYFLVRRIGFSIQVLRELYAETNQILILARVRFGGGVAESWKIKAQVVST